MSPVEAPRRERSRVAPLLAYPKQSEAAKMLGIAPSTISRDPDVHVHASGRRDKRLSPSQVMELADRHRRRSLNAVALDLLRYAQEHDPERAAAVEAELNSFFAGLGAPAFNQDLYVEEARRGGSQNPKELEPSYDELAATQPVALVEKSLTETS